MSEPKRVLQVLTIMNQGGAETMVMNYYRAIDRSKVQFDFLVHRQERGVYDDEIEMLGGRIFRALPIRPWTYISYFRWLDAFFKEHQEFVAIHSHIQENSGFVFKYAQKHGLYNCIAHSHIADLGFDYKYLFREFGKRYVQKYATRKLSCGEDAGRFLYGERKFANFNNAIDAERFKFSPAIRSEIRQELGLSEDTFILGSVARFGYQKNHAFMLEIMKELSKKHSDYRLLLVGGGEEEQAIRERVSQLNLEKHVLFLGLRKDIYRVLQAFDIFLMPSLFEGLPVSIIEAQAAGLKCVLSDTIDRKVDLTGNIIFIPLEMGAEAWAEKLLELRRYERKDTTSYIIDAAYDVKSNLETLYSIYLGLPDLVSEKPLVSVGIPVYNAAKYVERAVRSVLEQSYSNIELIITNDGSTDASMDLARKIQDPRIHIYDDGVHRGISYRLNEQVKLAKGRYFARMDADDVMIKNRIEKQLDFFSKHPEATVVGSNVVVIDDADKIVGWRGENPNEKVVSFTRVRSFLHPTIVAPVEWFRTHPYRSECDSCEDYDLCLRTNKDDIYYTLSTPLLYYRDLRATGLSSYLKKRNVERHVLTLNKRNMSCIRFIYSMIYSYTTTFIVVILKLIGFENLLFSFRNHSWKLV